MQRLRIKTASDIISLKGYVPKVDPDATPLSHIVDSYDIRPAVIKCSLCGQEHMDGRIVALMGGGVTNIGHVCGAKFGEKYAQALEQYRASLTGPILVQKMVEGNSKVDSLQLRLLSLQNRAEDLHQRVQHFESMFPDTYQALRRRAFENKFDIFESVERSKAEIDDLMAANPFQDRERLKTREVHRGTIAGHRFPGTDWSSEQSAMRLFKEASQFMELDPRHLSMPAMRRWANWLDDFESNLQTVEQILDEGSRFFSQANFPLFALLPASSQAQDSLKTLTINELDQRPRALTVSTQPSSAIQQPLGRIRAKPPQPAISLRELRRLTGNKKLR